MQKYIFFILIIFINLTAYAKENNSTVSAGAQGYINNLMLDKELTGRSGIVVEKGTITYTDSYSNKVTKEIKEANLITYDCKRSLKYNEEDILNYLCYKKIFNGLDSSI